MRRKIDDLIVLLPGILGSVLQKDGRDLWGLSPGAISNAILSLGRNIGQLAIPGTQSNDARFDDGVVATGLMPDLHLIPWLWKIDGYGAIVKTLNSEFKLEAGRNFFEFPYDWRLDNRISAQKLKVQVNGWLRDWRKYSGRNDARLILIGHSMGGLVARYFLECLEGWRNTRMLVTFGTPFRGSLNAVNFICNGLVKKVGYVKLIELSEMLRSFTSVYQLLPIYKCFDNGDGRLSRLSELESVPNMDLERVKDALKFHREIENAVENNRTNEEYIASRCAVHPIIGINQSTFQSAQLQNGSVEMLKSYEDVDEDGDGTVPRVSAIPIELSHSRDHVYANAKHGSLQNTESVLFQLRGLLSGLQIDLAGRKGVVPSAVGLEIEDAYTVGDRIKAFAYADTAMDLAARVVDVQTNAQVFSGRFCTDSDRRQAIEIGALPQGAFRIFVTDGRQSVEPISDTFVVLPG